jgi:hypothetical protein
MRRNALSGHQRTDENSIEATHACHPGYGDRGSRPNAAAASIIRRFLEEGRRLPAPPDAVELLQVMSLATAPAFVLGAVAGFVAVLLNRMTNLIERIRGLNEIADHDAARSHLKSDIPRLRQRIKLLNGATFLALLSGLCTAWLVVVGFVSALFRLPPYGAPLLFGIALLLLGGALFRFGQEVRMGPSEADHYR